MVRVRSLAVAAHWPWIGCEIVIKAAPSKYPRPTFHFGPVAINTPNSKGDPTPPIKAPIALAICAVDAICAQRRSCELPQEIK